MVPNLLQCILSHRKRLYPYVTAMAGPSAFKELPQVYFDDSLPLVLTYGDISVHNVKLGTDGKVWLLEWYVPTMV